MIKHIGWPSRLYRSMGCATKMLAQLRVRLSQKFSQRPLFRFVRRAMTPLAPGTVQNMPERFKRWCDDGPAGCLHYTGAHKQPSTSEPSVVHPRRVVFKVDDLLTQKLGILRSGSERGRATHTDVGARDRGPRSGWLGGNARPPDSKSRRPHRREQPPLGPFEPLA